MEEALVSGVEVQMQKVLCYAECLLALTLTHVTLGQKCFEKREGGGGGKVQDI